jgi:hypothetical protein
MLEPEIRDPAARWRDLPRDQRRQRHPAPNPKKEWKRSKMKIEDLLAPVNSGFICDPYLMEKSPDEVPMYAWFVERGLALPASDFFKGLLKYYDIEYLNLNLMAFFTSPSLSTSAKPSWGSNPIGSCFESFSV